MKKTNQTVQYPYIIATSGQIAAGTSSISKALAEKIGYKFIDVGQIFRQISQKYQKNVNSFQKIANNNPEIDQMLEKNTLDLIKKHKKVVVSGKVTPWFLHNHKIKSYNIFFKADMLTRAQRIKNRDKLKNLAIAKQELISRERAHRQRYKKQYFIDRSDLSIYNIKINTANISVEQTVNIILDNFI